MTALVLATRHLLSLAALAGAAIALLPAPAQARTEVMTLRSEPFRLAGFKTTSPNIR